MHLKPSTRPKKGRLPLQFLLELCHFLGSCCEARLRFQGFLLQVLILGGKGTQAHWYSRMPSSNIRRRYLFCRVPRKYLGAWLVLPTDRPCNGFAYCCKSCRRHHLSPGPCHGSQTHRPHASAMTLVAGPGSFFFSGEKLRFAKTNLRSNFRLHLGSTWIKKRLGNISLSRHRKQAGCLGFAQANILPSGGGKMVIHILW